MLLNKAASINSPYKEKLSPFECGMEPVSDTRVPFAISFYLVAILFLIFDLEILFMYPLAVTLYQITLVGFWVAMIFLFILTVAFLYELSQGVIE